MKIETDELQRILNECVASSSVGGMMSRIEFEDFVWEGASESLEPSFMGRGFYICSLSKTYTAVAVLRFVEEGLLSLDDSISKYLDDMECFGTITIRNLLNHSSRIQDYVSLEGYLEAAYANPLKPWSKEHLLSRIKALPLVDSSDLASH